VCTEGQGRQYWRNQGAVNDYRIRPGSVCFASGGVETDSAWHTGSWHFLAVAVDASKFVHLADQEANAINSARVQPQFDEDVRVAALVQQMFAEAKAGCPSGRLFGESLSLALLSYVAAKYAQRSPRAGEARGAMSALQRQRVLRYIRENLSRDFTIADLAAYIGMSAAHFSRLFKASFGVSPYQFVMSQRILKARQLLESSNLDIGSIALDLGFPTHSHFSKIFRQVTGITPTRFKRGN
jgi:AraC family transcriptional regulator